MATFSMKPNYTVPLKETPRILKAQFGDGYSQVTPDGLNPMPQIWNLKFTKLSSADFQTFRNFIRARWDSQNPDPTFDWIAPRPVGDGVTTFKFRCEDWDYTFVEEEAFDVEATFVQVFE